MRLQSKKDVGGKPVVIYDTEGYSVEEIIDQMIRDGWFFDKLVVKHKTSNGEVKHVDIPANKVHAIQQKYHFSDWIFKAHRNNQVLAGRMNDEKNLVFITASKGKGVQYINNMVFTSANSAFSQPIRSKNATPQAPIATQHEYDAKAAADALYEPDEEEQPEVMITPEQKAARRINERVADNDRFSEVQPKKHIFMRILSVLLWPTVVSSFFGAFAFRDLLRCYRNATEDPDESRRNFKDARRLLIFGYIAVIALVVVFLYPLFSSGS